MGTISSVNVSGNINKVVFTRSASGSAVSVPAPVPMTILPLVRQNSWSTKSLTDHPTFKDDVVVIQCLVITLVLHKELQMWPLLSHH